MFPSSASVVLGYQWIAFGGKQACEQCAVLNGREFYRDPAPGQASVADMPHPPLHPNCGCKLLEIVDVTRAGGGAEGAEGEQGLAATDQQPQESGPGQPEVFVDSIVGLSWRRGAVAYGPVHGRFCGKGWTNGRHDPEGKYRVDLDMDGLDDLDEACKAHDLKYEAQKYATADRQLVAALAALPVDPRTWPKKPPAEKIEEAGRYRKWALLYFQGAVAARERNIQDANEWGYDVEGEH